MRLYLSSFRLGDEPRALLDLLDGGTRAAVIVNAADDKSADDRAAAYELERAALAGLGLEPSELDLRDYFDRPDALRERLEAVDLLWIRGGNVFVLRRALARCDAEELLMGAIMLTPNLHGAELVDDPGNVPPGYPPEITWDCLGVLPFHIAPHYRSGDDSESAAIDHLVTYLIDNHLPFIALRDGEALVFDGERKAVVGGPD